MSSPTEIFLTLPAVVIRATIESTEKCLKAMTQVRANEVEFKFDEIANLFGIINSEIEKRLLPRIKEFGGRADSNTTEWTKLQLVVEKAAETVETAKSTILKLSTQKGQGKPEWSEFDTLARLRNYDGPGLRNEAENLRNHMRPSDKDDYDVGLCLVQEIGELLRYFAWCLGEHFEVTLKGPKGFE